MTDQLGTVIVLDCTDRAEADHIIRSLPMVQAGLFDATHFHIPQLSLSCSAMTVSELTKQIVRKRASYLCEYCHSPEKISTSRFTIDHIQPRSLSDSDEPDNLALACSRCNQRRYNFIVDQYDRSNFPVSNRYLCF